VEVSMEIRVERDAPVRAAVGDSLVLTLPENGTTGYQWVVSGTPDFLEVVADDVVPPGSAAPGAGGMHRWRWTARRPGSGRLVLELRRPWQRESAPEDTVVVEVSVADRSA
jgi:inhibitor of cysteine peptidase